MSFNNLDMLYRQVIMDHYKNPRNRGVIEDGVTVDLNNPTCGDSLRLQLQVEDDIVKDAKFEGEGCSISLASASMMTQIVKGKTVEEALQLANIFSEMVQGKSTTRIRLTSVISRRSQAYRNSRLESSVPR